MSFGAKLAFEPPPQVGSVKALRLDMAVGFRTADAAVVTTDLAAE